MFSEYPNSEAYDLAEFHKAPVSFVIASTPRCGSTLLGRLLWESEIAGAPHEYFHTQHAKDYYERWGYEAVEEYVSLLKRWRSTPNGIFGVKLHYYQIEEFGLDTHKLEELLGSPKYIFIRRKTKIRQAISLVKAEQTNQYCIRHRCDLIEAEYDFEAVRDQFFRLISEESKWEEFFKVNDINPLVVWYEELAEDHEKILKEIYHYLSVGDGVSYYPSPTIKKMSNDATEEWVRQFNEDMRSTSK